MASGRVSWGSESLCFFRVVSSTELSALENICKTIIKEKQPFERLEVSKDTLLEMFKVTGKMWRKILSLGM